MNELALFAGVGGGIIGGQLLGWKTVCAVEASSFCREVLLRRQRDGVLPLFPIWSDARTFDGRQWRSGVVDILTAGFPCQPWSVAGKKEGENDERNLWPETLRIIREVRPRYVLLENVAGLIPTDYFGEIIGSLARERMDAWWCVVSAADCGAPHIRRRVWIVAYQSTDAIGKPIRSEQKPIDECEIETESGDDGDPSFVANADSWRCQELWLSQHKRIKGSQGTEPDGSCSYRELVDPANDVDNSSRVRFGDWRKAFPDFLRVADGIPDRVDRLRSLGNAQCPPVVADVWRRFKQFEKRHVDL